MSATDLAAKLITIPSVSPMRPALPTDAPCEAMVTRFLLEWFRARNIQATAFDAAYGRENVVACLPGAADRPVLLFDAHQDTVPADRGEVRSFEPRIENGRLYGRGACDVKGPLAAMLIAVERLSQLAESSRPTVVFIATCDEEFGQLGAIDLVARWRSRQLGNHVPYDVQGIIVAEPTSLNPVVAHNGVLRWTLTTQGRAAHSSRPELGVSAIDAMGDVIVAWRDYGERLRQAGLDHPRCGRPRTSIGKIQGGSAVNIVAERCKIEIDRRLVPGETVGQVWEEVAEILAALPGANIQCSPAFTESLPLNDELNVEFAERMRLIVKQQGRESELIGVGFGTHAPRYAELGAPVIVFGPGSIDQAHTADEWIDINELECAAEIFYELARDFR